MRAGARQILEIVTTALLLAVATVMIGVFLHDREMARPDPGSAEPIAANWREWEDTGILMGPKDAPMVVAVFMDFNCTYCRDLAAVLDSLRAGF